MSPMGMMWLPLNLALWQDAVDKKSSKEHAQGTIAAYAILEPLVK